MQNKETGKKSIYVNPDFTRRIKGLRKEESDWLLSFLYKLPLIPELQLRAPWKNGTLVIWDNERVQHYAIRDKVYDRILHRTMIWEDPRGAKATLDSPQKQWEK